MISTLLFDFNNVLLFVEESTVAAVANSYQKISVPTSWSKFFYLNTELLSFIGQQQETYTTAILTASEFSLYQPEIKTAVVPYFNHLFFAKDRGWAKDLPATYLAAAQELGVPPADILFTDDKLENVQAAEHAGLAIHHFIDNKQLFVHLSK